MSCCLCYTHSAQGICISRHIILTLLIRSALSTGDTPQKCSNPHLIHFSLLLARAWWEASSSRNPAPSCWQQSVEPCVGGEQNHPHPSQLKLHHQHQDNNATEKTLNAVLTGNRHDLPAQKTQCPLLLLPFPCSLTHGAHQTISHRPHLSARGLQFMESARPWCSITETLCKQRCFE